MKMKIAHFNELKIEIVEICEQRGFTLPLDTMAENRINQAWRFFHYVNKLNGYRFSDRFYTYLNDSHIQTALLKILYG
jgi:hypothetical protein